MEYTEYTEYIEKKLQPTLQQGFVPDTINPFLFEYNAAIVKWALSIARAAVWADCGNGKTPIQLEWAHHVCLHTGGNVLIFAPLAVTEQTQGIGVEMGIDTNIVETQADIKPGINITNYEKMHHFFIPSFAGVVLDESSILKSHTGKYRTALIEAVQSVHYRLACTATPSPNDETEIGNHAEFLGVCTRLEMLAKYFTHNSGNTSQWELKKWGSSAFWEWLTSWAVMFRTPVDIGYQKRSNLPQISYFTHTVHQQKPNNGELFVIEAKTQSDRQRARRATIQERCEQASSIINGSEDDTWLVMCNLNDESKLMTSLVDGAQEVTGSMPNITKAERMTQFTNGEIKILVSKPKICGFGMNWQHCHNLMIVGLSDSYEMLYQVVRRLWRYGQTHDVSVHIVIADTEGAVLKNIKKKELKAEIMFQEMIRNMKPLSQKVLNNNIHELAYISYLPPVFSKKYTLYHGDCVDKLRDIEDNTVDYSIFSPPFADLYVYSDSPFDMGNCADYDDFFTHYMFLIDELYRILKPGRLVSFHCMDLPMMKERDGTIGLKDFPARSIAAYQEAGFIYHGKHIVWKDPLTEATRTKALGLMHKQLVKDSAMSRAGLPDYLVTMRKPGKNLKPVYHHNGLTEYHGNDREFSTFLSSLDEVKRSHNIWRRYASPVWMDIRQGNTLNKGRKGPNDGKHICPLQLDTIARGITLYSNPGDTVLTPYAGIGSEVYQSIVMGRKAIGIELKQSYFETACINAESSHVSMGILFG